MILVTPKKNWSNKASGFAEWSFVNLILKLIEKIFEQKLLSRLFFVQMRHFRFDSRFLLVFLNWLSQSSHSAFLV